MNAMRVGNGRQKPLCAAAKAADASRRPAEISCGLPLLRDILPAFAANWLARVCSLSGYGIFGIAVDLRIALKWLFHREKATFPCTKKAHTHSENALKDAWRFLSIPPWLIERASSLLLQSLGCQSRRQRQPVQLSGFPDGRLRYRCWPQAACCRSPVR